MMGKLGREFEDSVRGALSAKPDGRTMERQEAIEFGQIVERVLKL